MKKRIMSVMLIAVLLLCMNVSVFADTVQESTGNVTSITTETGVEFSKLQQLFPKIKLGEDGYIEDNKGNYTKAYSAGEEKYVQEIYTSDYENGSCKLQVYSDGSYVATGYEKVEETVAPQSYDYGSENVGSGYYRSYVSWGTPQMSYTYKMNNKSGTNLYQITNLGNMKFNGSVGIQLVGVGVKTVRQVQTSSKPAEVYGDVKMNQVLSTSTGVDTVYNCTFRLITKVSYAKITVSVTTYR